MGSIRALIALSAKPIRALCRPISLSLNTGSLSPYFAIAQYGLLSPYFAIAQYGLWVTLLPAAIRALAPAMCSFHCAHTPTLFYPGLRCATPRAVFWRPFRAPSTPTAPYGRPLNTPVRSQVDDDCPILPLRLFIAFRRMIENRLWLALGDIIRRYGQFYTIGPFRLLSTAAYFVDDQIIGNDNHDFVCPSKMTMPARQNTHASSTYSYSACLVALPPYHCKIFMRFLRIICRSIVRFSSL